MSRPLTDVDWSSAAFGAATVGAAATVGELAFAYPMAGIAGSLFVFTVAYIATSIADAQSEVAA